MVEHRFLSSVDAVSHPRWKGFKRCADRSTAGRMSRRIRNCHPTERSSLEKSSRFPLNGVRSPVAHSSPTARAFSNTTIPPRRWRSSAIPRSQRSTVRFPETTRGADSRSILLPVGKSRNRSWGIRFILPIFSVRVSRRLLADSICHGVSVTPVQGLYFRAWVIPVWLTVPTRSTSS